MKTLAFLFLFLMFHFYGASQNILYFFENIPDSSLIGLSKNDRKEIVAKSKDNATPQDAYDDLSNGIHYAFEVCDVRNGYLKIIGAFEGHIQMVYWNMTNGNKLIAIYIEGCGPVCGIEQIDFYTYNGKEFIPMDRFTVIPDIENDFIKGDIETQLQKMEEKDIIASLLFDLPRKGKNILAKWGNEDSQEVYKEYCNGDRMELLWDDGTFTKGKMYWEEQSN